MEAVAEPRKHKKKKAKEKPLISSTPSRDIENVDKPAETTSITDLPNATTDSLNLEDKEITQNTDNVECEPKSESSEISQEPCGSEEPSSRSILLGKVEKLAKVCTQMSEASEKLVPEKEPEELSDTLNDLTLEKIKDANEACQTVLETTKNLIPADKTDVNLLVNTKEIREREEILTPYTSEQLLNLVGSKEITMAEAFSVRFQNEELHGPAPTHPLYESLMEYQTSRSHRIFNQKEVAASAKTCENKMESLWYVKTCTKKDHGTCPEGIDFSIKYDYKVATLQNTLLNEYTKDLRILRNKATELHSLYSHSEHMHKIQVEEILWMAITQGEKDIKECFKILFWIMKNHPNKWGSDREMRNQLRKWCCSLSKALLKCNDSLENVLYIFHHILQLTHSIGWALHLVQVNVESSNDITKALCLLNGIFAHSSSPKKRDVLSPLDKDSDNAGVPVASEATDESLWIVVDSDGEDGLIETASKINSLSENDLLGFLRQVPFERIFRNLLLIRNFKTEDIFCGEHLTGKSVLKIFATCQLLLSSFRMGLTKYITYQELTKELCRLSLHSIMYSSDLWESASANCEPNLLERLIIEYNSVFMTAWSTIECAGFKDTSAMFLSEMPFGRVSYDIIKKITDDICRDLNVSDSISCYYFMACLSNIAISRNEDDIVKDIINYLFKIGFDSEYSELSCGEWSRTLCGASLSSNLLCMSDILLKLPKTVNKQWLEALPITNWRPHPDEILTVLKCLSEGKMDLLPYLLKFINWNTTSGVDRNVHRQVALFLCSLSQKQKIVAKNSTLPEWYYDMAFLLKLHPCYWNTEIDYPNPEDINEYDVSGKCHFNSMIAILSTTWGREVHLIIEKAAPLLLKIINAGRYKEAIHILHYILPQFVNNPQTIVSCKIFEEIFNSLLKAEKGYSKKAVRLISGDSVGPVIKLLLLLIESHMKNFKKFNLTSPENLLAVWINWLTSIDNWQGDWVIVHLLDTALKHCFLHPVAMGQAAKILEKFVETSASPKSPTSSSGLGSWLFSGSNTFRGLIQCNVEAPFLWHMVMWMEHNIIERKSGLWKRLVEKIILQKDGTKLNIDKSFKSVGGADNANGLVIYRSLQNAMSVSLDCPIYSLLWQLFFYLYLDISIVSSHLMPNKIIGVQFFHGTAKYGMINKAKQRLKEASQYHEAKIKQLTDKTEETDKIKHFHSQQSILMDTFRMWLEDDFFADLSNPRTFAHAFSKKCQMLISGNNVLWIDTVDMQQFNIKNSVTTWPDCISNEHQKLGIYHSVNFIQSNKAKSGSSTPDERVLLRIKTYEVPLVENEEYEGSKIAPLVDPISLNNYDTTEAILMKNLADIFRYSKIYKDVTENFTVGDDKVCDLIKRLYRHNPFNQKEFKRCGSSCKAITLSVSGIESLVNNDVKTSIAYNRKHHQSSIENALKPYEDLAKHTAKVSKICQHMTNSESWWGGQKFFHKILSSLRDENMNFPPVNQILDSAATQLGEKFISASSFQCVNLIKNCERDKCITLIRSLLKPSKLSTEDMLEVYSAVVNKVTDPHVAFSFLSKFNIFSWLCDSRPNYTQRNQLITIQCEALAAAGFESPNERIILHELLCVHLSKVLSWEFPVHLSQVLTNLTTMSINKQLPPSTWQHVFTVIETYPNLISQQQAVEILQSLGFSWWKLRGSCQSFSLYNKFSIYDYCIARLGALLSACVLTTAMLHQPPMLTDQISAIVFNSMISFWNPWLALWCNGQNQFSPSNRESPRDVAFMPWLPEDTDSPDVILNALVETLTYCIQTLPGSTNDFLRLTWQWYAESFIQGLTPFHVLNRIHRALEKLPWTKENTHWMSYVELQMMVKVSKFSVPTCHSFAAHCLGNIEWLKWYHSYPHEISSQCLAPILHLLFGLKPNQQVLDNALILPWSQLKYEQFQDVIIWYTVTLNKSTESFHSNPLLPLICAAGGLVKNSESSGEWQSKRSCLVRGWINAISSMTQGYNKVENNKVILSQNIALILEKIENTTMTLGNVSDLQKLVECSFLISNVVVILNMTCLMEIAQQEWLKWIKKTSSLCLFSVISCLQQVTQRDIFASLAEETISAYLKKGGDWISIVKKWSDSYIVPIEYLLSNSSFLTAFGTYKSLNRAKFRGNIYEELDKNILETLRGFDPSCSCEAETCLWICQMIFLMCDNTLNVESQKSVANQNITILEKWSQEPAWGLLKAMKIVQDTAPSVKFRFVARYGLCITLIFAKMVNIKKSTDYTETFDKNFAALDNMASSKCNEFKNIAANCVSSLKDQDNSIADFLKIINNTCSELYKESCYCNDNDNLFKL